MSELQLYLLAAGGIVILLVLVYNVVVERRARNRAEQAFGKGPGDALFGSVVASSEPEARREPTLGALPPSDFVEAAEAEARMAPRTPTEAIEAPGGPAAQISSRIDTVAVVLADDPVTLEQLEPLRDALATHATPVHVEGIVDEQWHPVDSSPRASWRELRVGLQLASRRGPVGEDEIERFNAAIAEFAATVSAVSQRESPAAAAARARELDRFCAEADVEVAVNVVGQFGATFATARVKALALDHGLSETASGELASFGAGPQPEFAIRRMEEPGRSPGPYYAGLTFTLDLPANPDPPGAFDGMVRLAETFARKLGGELVDDNRKPLTAAGIAAIRRTVEQVAAEMRRHGVEAGGALARRLFS